VGSAPLETVGDRLSFCCPRCGEAVVEDRYGPCTSCREALRAALGVAGGAAFTKARVEPKMNVVPNQVATKD